MSNHCPSCKVHYTAHLGLEGTCRKLVAAEAEIERLRQELWNIAHAKPSTWDEPKDFLAWAQNRARGALGEYTKPMGE
jgi:hypothetical protein